MNRALICALALSIATPALAAPSDAAELRKQGEQSFKAKQYVSALESYLAASRVTNDPALLYNIARCHHELGNYAEAYEHYRRFAALAPADLRAKVPHLDEKIAFVSERTARLKVTVNVEGATVTINGRVVTSLDDLRVNVGHVTVSASREGYVSDTQTVEATASATIVVGLRLVEAASGVLKVQANVATATVTIDDKLAGRVPLEVRLGVGAHRVVAAADGYEPWRRTVTIDAGAVHTADATLSRSTSTQWWIWAGVGVLVVSGAVVTYALLTERSADSGSYAPGQVSAGLFRF